MLKMSSICIEAYKVTSDDALTRPSKGPGADANGLTGIKFRWWSVSLFSIGAAYTTVFSATTDKNLKDWRQHTAEMHLKK